MCTVLSANGIGKGPCVSFCHVRLGFIVGQQIRKLFDIFFSKIMLGILIMQMSIWKYVFYAGCSDGRIWTCLYVLYDISYLWMMQNCFINGSRIRPAS